MQPPRFDQLARFLGLDLPRRGLLARVLFGLGSAALGAAVTTPRPATAQLSADDGLTLAATPCACDGDRCGRCLIGITGGGVVATGSGEAQLVLFASRLEVDSDDPAAGFVRWVIPGEGDTDLSLESVGPIAYSQVEGEGQAREVRGTMQVNGAGEYPFVLRAVDLGTAVTGQDTASLRVGNLVAEGSDFGYEGEGLLVGGDLQLLDVVAPVAAP